MAQGFKKKLDLTGQTFSRLEVLAANTVHRSNTGGGPSADLVVTKRLHDPLKRQTALFGWLPQI